MTSSHECGVEVSGSASVVLVPEAIPTVMDANPWDARTGTFVEQGERCGFTIEPWYTVQGANREAYLLTEPAYPTLDEQVAALPLPDAEHPEGAEDWDGDGVPGVAYRVSGAVNGRRNVVQRYWYQYFSSEGFTVPLGSTEFAVRAEFEAEESLIAVEGCDPFCGLLSTGSIVAPGYEHRAWFRRLGDDEADAAGRGEVIVADDRLESCFRLQEFMPHDPDEAEHRGIE